MQIELLSEVRKNHIKSITVNLPLNQLNEGIINEIEELSKNSKGNALLKFNVFDHENNMYIDMFSRNTKIDFTNNFLKFFDEHEAIEYRIN